LKDLFNLKVLRIDRNNKISKISHMTRLEILYANGNLSIDNNELKNLNLVVLSLNNNKIVNNVNHMTNLKTLYASGDSGIDDAGIKDLKLEKIDSNNNYKLTHGKRETCNWFD
jgi:hypothetical protein